RVFEIGSGGGDHAVDFAARFPHLTWQTSDLEENHAQIRANIARAGLDNVLAPLSFDAASEPDRQHCREHVGEAIFSCNTAHIMSWPAAQSMFRFAGEALPDGGRFVYYGPFSIGGEFNTPSNRDFDATLRSRDGDMGLRDLAEVDAVAASAGLRRVRLYAMPANNFVAVWIKHAGPTQ
ncbi:MAG: DUF938 domain-containing protein, partial [Woeseiaceae bacterium]|nr:DUF938 domain-containing protein [Woeseiaceae bacterium]